MSKYLDADDDGNYGFGPLTFGANPAAADDPFSSFAVDTSMFGTWQSVGVSMGHTLAPTHPRTRATTRPATRPTTRPTRARALTPRPRRAELGYEGGGGADYGGQLVRHVETADLLEQFGEKAQV